MREFLGWLGIARVALLAAWGVFATAPLHAACNGCTNFAAGVDWGTVAIDALKELERANVIAALERNDWIQSRAAKELGITLRQMGYRVKKFGLEPLVGQRKAVT